MLASSSVIPIAPPGRPPHIAFASVMMSGWTPNRWVAPPGEIVAPVLTSSKMSCDAVLGGQPADLLEIALDAAGRC